MAGPTTLLDQGDLDSGLARLLLSTGRLSAEQLAAHLDTPPGGETLAPPGHVTLARRLVSTGALNPQEVEACLRQLAAPPAAVRSGWRPGAVVDDYVLEERLGQGGMGVVYAARHQPTGARRALKALPAYEDPELVLRFQREGRAAARVDGSPNVARVYSCGTALGSHYLVMDLVKGGDLAGLLEAGPLEIERAAAMLEALARGVAHAHVVGVLHRDLKPANVLLDEQGVPKLVDFGLAWIQGDASLTQSGTVMGSPAYMAPEQAVGGGTDERTDVYGLGALLYATLTARPPFLGGSVLHTLAGVLNDAPTSPSTINPAVPAALEAICLRALAKKPEQRFASAQDMADALAGFLRGEEAPPSGLPLWVGAGAVFVLVLALGSSSLAFFFGSEGERASAERVLSPPVETAGPDSAVLREEYLAAMGEALEVPYPETQERLLTLAKELDPDAQRELAKAKEQLLAEQVGPWTAALEAGWKSSRRARGALTVLERLAAAASAAPAVRAPDVLNAALGTLLDQMLVATPQPDPTQRDALLRFEMLRLHDLRARHRPSPKFMKWIEGQINGSLAHWELVAAGVRCNYPMKIDWDSDFQGLSGLLARFPRSRAFAFLVISAAIATHDPSRGLPLPKTLVRVGESAVDSGGVDDLGLRYQRKAWERLADLILNLDHPGEALLEQALDAARRAHAGMEQDPSLIMGDLDLWVESHFKEDWALHGLGRLDEAERAREACLAALRNSSGPVKPRFKIFKLHVMELAARGDRIHRAVEVAEEMVELSRRAGNRRQRENTTTILASLHLDRRANPQAAEKAMQWVLPQETPDTELTDVAVRTALALGQVEEARRRLERGRSLAGGEPKGRFARLEELITEAARR